MYFNCINKHYTNTSKVLLLTGGLGLAAENVIKDLTHAMLKNLNVSYSLHLNL